MLNHTPMAINIRDIYGQTALYIACKWKYEEVTKFLLTKKANKDIVAHTCAEEDQCDTDCFKLLISMYGFDSLFDYSLTSYRKPLQLCVEKKSQHFFKSVVSCDKIK